MQASAHFPLRGPAQVLRYTSRPPFRPFGQRLVCMHPLVLERATEPPPSHRQACYKRITLEEHRRYYGILVLGCRSNASVPPVFLQCYTLVGGLRVAGRWFEGADSRRAGPMEAGGTGWSGNFGVWERCFGSVAAKKEQLGGGGQSSPGPGGSRETGIQDTGGAQPPGGGAGPGDSLGRGAQPMSASPKGRSSFWVSSGRASWASSASKGGRSIWGRPRLARATLTFTK
jgi:hypothetical protein